MKWASYVITAVRYSAGHSRIADVEVRTDNGTSLGPAMELTRQSVVNHLDLGFTFVTAYLRNGKWIRGADVQVVRIGTERFLRTDANRVRADNLGELPELPPRAGARW